MKYDMSKIMKRAWELVKTMGMNISGGLKRAWREAKKDTIIEKLQRLGASRWTKYGKDRLYFNSKSFMENVGFEYTTYKTGNISSASIDGDRVSNSEGYRILDGFSKLYLNIDTMTLENRYVVNENAESLIKNAFEKACA